MKNQKINTKKNNFYLSFDVQSFFRAYLHAVKTKAICFTYPLVESLHTRTFLTCLEKEMRIAGYHFVKDIPSGSSLTGNNFPASLDVLPKDTKGVVVFLSYDLSERKPLRLQLTFYSSKQRQRTVSYYWLQQFAQKNPTAFALIRTNVGFMTLKDCLQHHCGGEFLLTLV